MTEHLPHRIDPGDVLLPVVDVLTLQALERVGRWVIRHDRSRPKLWRGRPLHQAYLEWPVTDEVINKALRNAWDIIPAITARWEDFACLDDELLMNTLDTYVHDLIVTRTPHTVALLRLALDAVFPLN